MSCSIFWIFNSRICISSILPRLYFLALLSCCLFPSKLPSVMHSAPASSNPPSSSTPHPPYFSSSRWTLLSCSELLSAPSRWRQVCRLLCAPHRFCLLGNLASSTPFLSLYNPYCSKCSSSTALWLLMSTQHSYEFKLTLENSEPQFRPWGQHPQSLWRYFSWASKEEFDQPSCRLRLINLRSEEVRP